MLHNILEISKKTSKGGRVPIKIALLKIHEDKNETNNNGIHWCEDYVLDAIESVNMMPICASFCDDTKSVPLDHGLTGEQIDENGIHEPVFENSESVGVFEKAQIENITVNGNSIRALTANGYLYNQRYPSFVKWVRENYLKGEVDTSVEIMGTEMNDNNIIYEEENPTDEYRTPKVFVFSGSCILSVPPADANAIVLEVAEKKNKKEEQKMEINMDELKAVVQNTMSEINSSNNDFNSTIQELNSQIENLNAQLEEKDNTISELNASAAEMQKVLDKMKEDQKTYWAEREILEKEIAKAKVAEKLADLDSTLSEFNEDEKAVAKDDIDALKKNINACKKKEELNSVASEINSIKSKICMAIVEKQKKEEHEAKVSEQNNLKGKVDVEDIFSEMCTDSHEEDVEDTNIF